MQLNLIKVFSNGKIYTSNPAQKWVDTLVIYKNKIVFAGNKENATSFVKKADVIYDLKGKLVLPGFIDSHIHLVMGGISLINLDFREIKSSNDFITTISNAVKKLKPGKWIRGGNWNNENWEKTSLPNRMWIDHLTENNPLFLERTDYHLGFANSLALKYAGISKDTPNPNGGFIERDPVSNEPTGILKDKAMDLVYKIITPIENETLESATADAISYLNSFGITSIHDITYPNHFRIYKKLESEKRLNIRISSYIPIEKIENLINLEISGTFGSEKLKIAGVKAFSDGSLGAGTAYFFDSYFDNKENFGIPTSILSNGLLSDYLELSHKNGIQSIIHAIGDKANSIILDLYELNQDLHKNSRKLRNRIEHLQHLNEKDIYRLHNTETIASIQPYHLVNDLDWADKKIGNNRIKDAFRIKSLIGNNVKVCFGSDWPVVSPNPFLGIYAAITRKTETGKVVNPFEQISLEEAIRSYTIEAAFSSFQEKMAGSLETGKFSDFIILDRNIFDANSEDIKNTNIEATFFDGQLVFGNI